MSHRDLSHTADTGIEANADTLAGLIGELSEAMSEVIAPLEPERAERETEFQVAAETVEDLVVDALSELIYRMEADDLLFCAFSVEASIDPPQARVTAKGVPMATVEPWGPAIKAVTYHGLIVERRADGWYGRVYLDV